MREKMAEGEMKWAAHVTDWQFRLVGLLEVLGALGLILPGVFHVATFLTPLAAAGLALAMLGALLTHLRMGETERVAVPLILMLLALFVAIERSGPHQL
jgi:hypothetical protein